MKKDELDEALKLSERARVRWVSLILRVRPPFPIDACPISSTPVSAA
jgi:hypothetical protein